MNKFNIFLTILLILALSINYVLADCTFYAGDGTVAVDIDKGYKTFDDTTCVGTLNNSDGTTIDRSDAVTIGAETAGEDDGGAHIQARWDVNFAEHQSVAYFIPTKSLAEWNAFLAHKPSHMRAYELAIDTNKCTPTSHDDCSTTTSWIWVLH